MILYPMSVEYAEFTVTADLELNDAVQIAFVKRNDAIGNDTVWHAAEWAEDPALIRRCRLLLAGSQVTPVPSGAVIVPAGEYRAWIRLPDNPEVIIRRADTLTSR